MKRITYIILFIVSIYGVFYFTLGRSWLASLIFSAIAFGVLYVPINKIADKVDKDVDFYYYRTWLSRLLFVVGVVVVAVGVFLLIYLPFSFSLYGSIALAAIVCLVLFPFILSPLCNIDWPHRQQVQYMKKHKDEIVEKLCELMNTHGLKYELSASDICVDVKFNISYHNCHQIETLEEKIESIEDVEELGEELKEIIVRVKKEDEKAGLIAQRLKNYESDCIKDLYVWVFSRRCRELNLQFKFKCDGLDGWWASSYDIDFDRELGYYDNVLDEVVRRINELNEFVKQVKRLKDEYDKIEYVNKIDFHAKNQYSGIEIYFEIEVDIIDKFVSGGKYKSLCMNVYSENDIVLFRKIVGSRIDECRRRDEMVEQVKRLKCEYEKNEYIHEINTKIKEDKDEDIGLYFKIEVVYVKDKAITGGELWSFEVEAHSTSDIAMVEKKIDSRIDECRRRDQMVENAISKACKNYNISRTTVERCLQQ